MVKTVCGVEYDTEKSKIVNKSVHGALGDPEGYEETLYLTEDGRYFLYTNGGESSKYPKEGIKRMSRSNAQKWLDVNS